MLLISDILKNGTYVSQVDRRMLGDSLRGLRIYKNNQAKRSRNYILTALVELSQPSTLYAIESKIKEIISIEVQNEFEHGTFIESNARTKKTRMDIINSRLISTKTIRRHLNGLLKEDLIKFENKHYTLTDKILHEHEIISLAFGNIILLRLCQSFPKKQIQRNVEKYFVKLIKEFGIFVIYIFLRFLEPYEHPGDEKAEFSVHGLNKKLFPLTPEDKKKYRQLWISNTIPASLMLHFLEGMLGLVNFSDRLSSTKSAGDRFTGNEYADYELSRTAYQRLIGILESKFPSTYDRLKQGEKDFIDWCLSLSSQQLKQQGNK